MTGHHGRLRAALLASTALVGPAVGIAGVALSPTVAWAQCTEAGLTTTCVGVVVNQGPSVNTGYGSGAFNGRTINIQSGASVSGSSEGISVGGGNTVNNLGTLSGFFGFVGGGAGNNTIVNSGTITGTGGNAILFNGTGNTLKLTPTSSIVGNVVIQGGGGGTLQLGGSGAGTLDAGLINAAGQYRGFSAYQKVDGSTWTLTGTTTRVTPWQLLGGILSVSSNTNLGAGSGGLTFDGGTLQVTGTAFTSTARTITWGANGGGLDIADANNTFTLNQTLTGGGPLVKTGAGTLRLNGASTYSGGTAIDAGTLRLGVNSVFNGGDPANGILSSAVGTGPVILNGGKLQSGINNITLANPFAIAGGGEIDNADQRLTLLGPISDAVPNGAGPLTFSGGTNGLTIVSGNNSYTGGTLITGTTVQARDNNAFGTGDVTLRDAWLQVGGTGGPFTIVNNFNVQNTSVPNTPSSSTIDNNGKSLTLSGNITGDGGVEFFNSNPVNPNPGRIILQGTNTYTGGTTICACTIVQLGDGSHVASLLGTITNLGQLEVLRADMSGVTTLDNNGGYTAFRNTTDAGTMTINNKLGGSALEFSQSASAGNATINNEALSTIDFYNFSSAGNATINNLADPVFGPGLISFNGGSNAGTATINNAGAIAFLDQSTAQSAKITNSGEGLLIFFNQGKAGSANIQINDTAGVSFVDRSSAENATIVNSADTLNGGGLAFGNQSTAGNAFITTNNGALTGFAERSNGGTARFLANAGGVVDFSQTLGAASDKKITAGSIEGAGDYWLGGNQFTVGSNNLSTTVSGTINDGVSPLLQMVATCGCLTFNTGASLVKEGTGTLTLSGINTYSGGTTFAGGTVSVSQDANLGALAGGLTFNGGVLQVTGTAFTATARAITWDGLGGGFDIANAANTFTVNQVLGGPGGLLKDGLGTLVLGGANTYAGGTTLAAGTLGISANNNIGTGPLAMLNATTLALTDSFQFTHNVTASGHATVDVAPGKSVAMTGAIANGGTTGDLTKTGTGTLILAADNTYTGGTTISGGKLQLGNGGTTGSLVGNVLNNAAFAISRSDILTFGGLISGTGSFEQAGVGTTIFTNANTYGGGTTVSAGRLQLGNGGTTGSLVGNVLNNATFAINRSDTFTYAGVISGSGAFEQAGAGTTIFTNANTYAGGTTISAGKLQAGDGGTTGSLVGDVLNNATFAVNRSNTFTYAGAMSGTGAFQQLGAGTTVFTNANTYTGGTTISAGKLQVGDGGSTGSLVGNVLNNTAFAVNRSNTFTFGGVISGAGTFEQAGAGTTVFTSANTYSGGTTVSAGRLQLGNGGATGSLFGNVLNNATFAINRSDAFTYAGVISGTGAFEQAGTGTSIFTNANAYTGGTTISAGRLQLGDGGTTGSILGNVLDNGTLAFNRSNTLTFDGVISGSGALEQNGAGKTILTASNSYTGTTTVNAGTLIVNGSIASSSSITVNSGATLGGTGTLGSTTINGGTLSPGNSIGTVNIAGSLNFVGPGNYVVEVSPTAADRTNVTGAPGTAAVGGTLSAVGTGGKYSVGTRYTVLNATGGVSGTFSNLAVSGNFGVTKPHIEYDANNVYIVLDLNGLSLAGLTRNQTAVASAINNAVTAGSEFTLFGTLFALTPSQLPGALDQLSGEIHASNAGALLDESLYARSAVLGRLRQASYGTSAGMGALSMGGPQAFAADGTQVIDAALAYAKSPIVAKAPMKAPSATSDVVFWAQGFGASGRFDSDGNAATLRRNLAGFFSGVDTSVGPSGRAGVMAGYTASNNSANGRGNANVETGHISGYGGLGIGNFNLRAGGAYAFHTIDTSRTINFPGLFDNPTAHYDGRTGQIFGEVGYGFAFGNLAIEPFAGAAYVSLHTDGATERGGPAPLALAANAIDVSYSTLGVRAAGLIPLGQDMVLVPRVSAAWQHAFDAVTPDARVALLAAPVPFTVAGVPLARDALLSEAGLDLAIGRNATIGISYVGQLARTVQDHAAKGKFSWKF